MLINQTSDDVRVYADPFCIVPSGMAVKPGHGAHVPLGSGGSFSA